MMVAFGSKIRANRELERRVRLARLAVTEERLRISRDVHDLLGHSLSVVALKSELAGRLIESDPGRARSELDDVQRVTRQALADVRAAVHGYRQLALSEAVGSARAALQAAGIDCRVERSEPVLSTEVESVLAWAVREATTNVVRHSNARVCEISVRADGDRVELAVDDDGSAEEPREGQGSGLNGLAERAEGRGRSGPARPGRLPARSRCRSDVIRVLLAEDRPWTAVRSRACSHWRTTSRSFLGQAREPRPRSGARSSPTLRCSSSFRPRRHRPPPTTRGVAETRR